MRRTMLLTLVFACGLALGLVLRPTKPPATRKPPEVDWSGVPDLRLFRHVAGRDGDSPVPPGTYKIVSVLTRDGETVRPHGRVGADVVVFELSDEPRTVLHAVRVP